MRLHHFTSANALIPIARHGLTIGDVPTDLVRNQGVVGVWLTSADTPDGLGLEGAAVDKRRIMLVLDVPADSLSLRRWDDWKLKNVEPRTIAVLERTAGAAADPSTWYVYFGWLKAERVVEAVDTSTGLAIEGWQAGLPSFDPVEGVAYRDAKRWHRAFLRFVRRNLLQR